MNTKITEQESIENIMKWADSAEMDALELMFSAGGSSVLYLLIYPPGTLDRLKTALGRAEWSVFFEETYPDTRLEVNTIPGPAPASLCDSITSDDTSPSQKKKKKEVQYGSIGLSPISYSGQSYENRKPWSAFRKPGGLDVRKKMMDTLDSLAGTPSIRMKPQTLIMFADFSKLLIENMNTLPENAVRSLGGCSVLEGFAKVQAILEKQELEKAIVFPEVNQSATAKAEDDSVGIARGEAKRAELSMGVKKSTL